MPELHDDFDLRPREDPAYQPSGDGRPVGVWIALAVLVIAAGVAAYIVFRSEPPEAPPQTVAAPAPPEPAPLGTEPAPVDVPPLAESDPAVRDLVNALSTHPRIASWLATDGLIRNFTTVVLNIAEGTTPSGHLTRLRPSTAFEVVERGEELYIDPASYDRYSGIAEAAASIRPADAARLYTTLKPRIQEAYAELGFPGESFDPTLERAIVELLRTPVPREPIRVEPKGIGYGYADEKLETLSAAQKQLLRLGPRNMRIVQRALRETALELGIPSSRLPPA